MSDAILQGEYEALDAIAKRFQQQSQQNNELIQRVSQRMKRLESTWAGLGSQAFFGEMQGEVLPAMKRLTGAMTQASKATTQISQLLRQAELEAAALFRGHNGTATTAGGSDAPPLLFSVTSPGGTRLEPTPPPDPTEVIAEAARRGDWGEVYRLLAILPPDRRAEVAFHLGDTLDEQTLKAIYADPTYGAQNIHLLTQGMAEYVQANNTQANRDVLGRVAYLTTHAGLIDERGDEDLPQEIIERARRDPEYGEQIAQYLDSYVKFPYPDDNIHQVVYRDGELIHVIMTPLWGYPGGAPVPAAITEEPITEAFLQSLYADHSYSGLDSDMSDNPVHVDEYAFTITAPAIPPGQDAEQYIYSRIIAQMGTERGFPPSVFNFPGITGMPQRGDAVPIDLPDPGFVVVSDDSPVLRVRTVTFPGVDSHPLNGAREWGVEQIGPDTYRVYTRGVARDDTFLGGGARSAGIERNFWRGLMGGVASDLTADGMAPPPVMDWSFGATVPAPPEGDQP